MFETPGPEMGPSGVLWGALGPDNLKSLGLKFGDLGAGSEWDWAPFSLKILCCHPFQGTRAEKPGVCPQLEPITDCVKDNYKCCQAGCGSVCSKPNDAKDKGVTEARPRRRRSPSFLAGLDSLVHDGVPGMHSETLFRDPGAVAS